MSRYMRPGMGLATALVTLLVACTTSAQPAPPASLAASPCTPGVCVIRVFVDDCQAPGGIRLDRPLVEVDRAVNMRWEIATPGFVFAENGIEFSPPNAQFQPQHSPRPNEFRLHNAKSAAGDFYYFVNIQGCRQHDPWVRNRA